MVKSNAGTGTTKGAAGTGDGAAGAGAGSAGCGAVFCSLITFFSMIFGRPISYSRIERQSVTNSGTGTDTTVVVLGVAGDAGDDVGSAAGAGGSASGSSAIG